MPVLKQAGGFFMVGGGEERDSAMAFSFSLAKLCV